MKNSISSGDQLTLAMPYAVTTGGGVKVGLLFGVANGTYANGEEGVIDTCGVFNLAKDTSVFAVGAAVYWDNTAKLVTATVGSNSKIGVATKAALTGEAVVCTILNEAW